MMRFCPNCCKEVFHTNKYSFDRAVKKNLKCKDCTAKSKDRKEKISKAMSGKNNYWYGKTLSEDHKTKLVNAHLGSKHSESTKQKMSLTRKGRVLTEDTKKRIKQSLHRPDIRKKHLDALTESGWLIVKTDKGQLEMLDRLNRMGFKFYPNYQLKTDNALFYIDGYDIENRIVVEYDSKYHKRRNQKEKDLIRQKLIIEIMKPKHFWRFDDVDKKWRTVAC